ARVKTRNETCLLHRLWGFVTTFGVLVESARSTTLPIPVGTRLGPHEILTAVGSGGMGEVYLARDLTLGRHVAIKVLPAEALGDAERLERFEREARVLASLNHPNIATIHGFDTSGTRHLLVMELVEGATLADRIASGPVP